ncbi:MAG: hypothetical protein JJ992_29175, partial [Planctomycetes bacterium]|nr:hypothetical protein [Planctomycetota bacterium]
ADSGPSVPIEPTLAGLDTIPRLNPCPRLGFRHAAVCLETPPADTSPTIAALLHRHYREMLALIDLPDPLQEDGVLAGAYNLLLTRRWMLLVTVEATRFSGISCCSMRTRVRRSARA